MIILSYFFICYRLYKTFYMAFVTIVAMRMFTMVMIDLVAYNIKVTIEQDVKRLYRLFNKFVLRTHLLNIIMNTCYRTCSL